MKKNIALFSLVLLTHTLMAQTYVSTGGTTSAPLSFTECDTWTQGGNAPSSIEQNEVTTKDVIFQIQNGHVIAVEAVDNVYADQVSFGNTSSVLRFADNTAKLHLGTNGTTDISCGIGDFFVQVGVYSAEGCRANTCTFGISIVYTVSRNGVLIGGTQTYSTPDEFNDNDCNSLSTRDHLFRDYDTEIMIPNVDLSDEIVVNFSRISTTASTTEDVTGVHNSGNFNNVHWESTFNSNTDIDVEVRENRLDDFASTYSYDILDFANGDGWHFTRLNLDGGSGGGCGTGLIATVSVNGRFVAN
jgi:hypothetical protein